MSVTIIPSCSPLIRPNPSLTLRLRPRGRRLAADPAGTVMFGADLRTRRAALGLTQAQLARALGVNRETVAHWEQGVNRPANTALIVRALDALAADQPHEGTLNGLGTVQGPQEPPA